MPLLDVKNLSVQFRSDGGLLPTVTDISFSLEKGEMLAKAGAESGEIMLGVRPEHIVLSKTEEGAIPCTLEVNEMMGSELHLHVFTEDGTRLIVRIPTIDLTAEDRASLVRGKKLFISFEGKVMHFFDKETQKNLLVAEE